jgi:hypothetical protein
MLTASSVQSVSRGSVSSAIASATAPTPADPSHPAPVQSASPVLCCYHNTSGQLQILRLARSAPQPLEKIVFPGERLLFNASPDLQIEVYSRSTSTVVGRAVTQVVDRLSCAALRVTVPGPSAAL